MEQTVDAIVMGGGLAGSSLAKQLADRGWSTLLLDRQHFPRHKPCGEFLSPETQGTLKELGLHSCVRSLHPVNISSAALIFPHGDKALFPLPGSAWGVSRYEMDVALHEAAVQAGVDVITGTTVIKVKQQDEGYSVEAKMDGQRKTYQARTVFAAWGSHRRSGIFEEPYPSDQGIFSVGKSLSYVGLKSHFTDMQCDEIVELYIVKGGYVGISPIENGLANVAALLPKSSLQGGGKTVEELLLTVAEGNIALTNKLVAATPVEGTQVSVSPIHLSSRPIAWHGLPHLGDAAVMIPPLCGDGMSIALRSALICAQYADRYLRGQLTYIDWKNQYTKAINQQFGGLVRRARVIHSLSLTPGLARLAPRFIQQFPSLARSLVRATRLKDINT